jgi:hypothetical protein
LVKNRLNRLFIVLLIIVIDTTTHTQHPDLQIHKNNLVERNAAISKPWADFKTERAQWCLLRGRIMDYAAFIQANKPLALRIGENPNTLWTKYNETWDSLVGVAARNSSLRI